MSIVKLIVQVFDAEAKKYCPVLMLVVLIKKQSEKTLKLLVIFQMMRNSSFTEAQVTTGR